MLAPYALNIFLEYQIGMINLLARAAYCSLAILLLPSSMLVDPEVIPCYGLSNKSVRFIPKVIWLVFMIPLGKSKWSILAKTIWLLHLTVAIHSAVKNVGGSTFSSNYLGVSFHNFLKRMFSDAQVKVSPRTKTKMFEY